MVEAGEHGAIGDGSMNGSCDGIKLDDMPEHDSEPARAPTPLLVLSPRRPEPLNLPAFVIGVLPRKPIRHN